jgi:hypothetical protein
MNLHIMIIFAHIKKSNEINNAYGGTTLSIPEN